MRIIITILIIFCVQNAWAQNLIPNPSFEDTIVPKVTPLYLPADWSFANSGSPDYMTPLHQNNRSAPLNFAGYQVAHTGNAYMGILIYELYFNTDARRFREYLQNEFSKPLERDSMYCLQTFVSLADSFLYASKNKLGVYFSNNKIQSNNSFFLPYTPQIILSPNSFIQEKQEWVQFDFQYKANGGERYLTIGNFTDSTEIDTLNVGGGTQFWQRGTYYYIDDVYLGHCDSVPFDTGVGLVEQNLIQRNHLVYPNPSTSQFNLEFEVKAHEKMRFILYDVQGQVCREEELQPGQLHPFRISSMRSGIYFYKIIDQKGSYLSGKLIVE